MSAWAVSLVSPTSVSLTSMSGRSLVYASTDAFWLIPVNDQNSKVFGSDDPEPPDPGVQPAVRIMAAAATAVAVVMMKRLKRPSIRIR
ncbi:hypothetical protein [Micromonospora sp. LOL_015]|uniref:hypothetical protein n=1 Tax=Micromonospora sp. LOL_015 TaxID=3345416 RepID=UPI003A843640